MKQEWECNKCKVTGTIHYSKQGATSVYEVLAKIGVAHKDLSPNCVELRDNLHAPGYAQRLLTNFKSKEHLATINSDTFSEFIRTLNKVSSELCPQ